MTEPLSREEREALMRWATTPENSAVWKVETDEAMRWELTVQAVEAERDALAERVEKLRQAIDEIVTARALETHDATAYSLYLVAWHAARADDAERGDG